MFKTLLILSLLLLGCNTGSTPENDVKTGTYSGEFRYGNFSDFISVEIKEDSLGWSAFFTSPAQNAIGIPLNGITVKEDSVSFQLQSDRYRYLFKNRWNRDRSTLEGILQVDSLAVPYTLEKVKAQSGSDIEQEEVLFDSGELKLSGTIFKPKDNRRPKAIVILTSSGSADRSASRAEATYFAEQGFITFHYDKRGTGKSQGDWTTADMKELLSDDRNAIKYFSRSAGISFSDIALMGSSQGAAKVPFLLQELDSLGYGIVVSCPGSSLLESDLNYWINRNRESIGEEHIDDAAGLQQKVFQFIAGTLQKEELEAAIQENQNASWFEAVWIPNPDEVATDSKLTYDPLPYFKKVKAPLLIIQGTKDEIIPEKSHLLIENALKEARNEHYEIKFMEGANHAMYMVADSDFPYWRVLHPGYLTHISNWLQSTKDTP